MVVEADVRGAGVHCETFEWLVASLLAWLVSSIALLARVSTIIS
jgi:hypothetical protein